MLEDKKDEVLEKTLIRREKLGKPNFFKILCLTCIFGADYWKKKRATENKKKEAEKASKKAKKTKTAPKPEKKKEEKKKMADRDKQSYGKEKFTFHPGDKDKHGPATQTLDS